MTLNFSAQHEPNNWIRSNLNLNFIKLAKQKRQCHSENQPLDQGGASASFTFLFLCFFNLFLIDFSERLKLNFDSPLRLTGWPKKGSTTECRTITDISDIITMIDG